MNDSVETGARSTGDPEDPATVERLLAMVMRLPRSWVGAMIAIALLSSVELDHRANHGWGFHFEVSAITLGAVGLIWLPAFLRLLSLAGGKLRGGGIEVSSGGLIGTPERMIMDLTEIRTEAEEVTKQSPTSETQRLSREIQRQVDVMASQYLKAAPTVDREATRRLSEEYEAARSRMPSGNARTIEMTRIVNEARVRASANRLAAARTAGDLLASQREGDRIIGLAFTQEAGGAYRLGDVLGRFEKSTSAFEMFQALIALREMEPGLELHQAESAVKVLMGEKTDPRGVGVMEDVNLPLLIDEVIDRLESFGQNKDPRGVVL